MQGHKFYSIKGLPGLDGLIVETNGKVAVASPHQDYASVDTIITNAVVGDRDLKFPLPYHSLLIETKFLTEIPDPTKEYSAQNPFGKHLYEGTFVRDALHITYTVFDNALSVTIYEAKPAEHVEQQKTLYSQNFFVNRKMAMELIEAVLQDKVDPDDLVFELDRCKREEAN